MDNSLVGRNLIDQILALREEVERRLKQNQYYVAMTKLDELLAAIRPLDIIEGNRHPCRQRRRTGAARPKRARLER